MNKEAALGGVGLVLRSAVYQFFFAARFLLLVGLFCTAPFGCRPASEGTDSHGSERSAPDERRVNTAAKRQSPIPNPQSPGSSPSPLPSAWPVFRGDAQGAGVSGGSLPEKLDLLWTFSTDKGGFESTAAIVDGVVYAGSTDGNLYAIDLATGKKRWEFATPLGFTASPAVQNGKVFIGDGDGTFYGIDAASGHKLWSFATEGQIDSSANFHAGRVLFGSQDSYLYCLNADSGKLVWKCKSPNQIRCFPTVADNRCFVAGCDGQLHIIDMDKGVAVGSVKIDSPTGNSPAVMEGTAFVGTEGQTFFAVDLKHRKILWRYEPKDRGAAFRSSAAVTPAAVIVGSRDRRLHALNPKTGQPLWSFLTKGRIDSSPVLVGDRVFVGSADGRLYAVDVKTGRPQWQFNCGGAVVASPAVAEGCLVIGNDAGQLYCFGSKKAGPRKSSGTL
jgi:outer membrane protein assembly factor BamB